MKNEGPHISIKPDHLFDILGFPITNTYLTSIIVLILFIFIILFYRSQINKTHRSSFFYLMQFMFKGIYNFFYSVLGNKMNNLFPLLTSLFLYILLLNWFGLLPGVGSIMLRVAEDHEHYHNVPLLRGNTTDLNTTLMLAIVAFGAIQYYGIKELGVIEYMKKFINFSNPISFITGILEIVSEFSRIISFAFRLFGNIFAGEVTLTIIAFLVPVLASFPFLMLEIFVGFIQAFVFTMLTAVFINLATMKAH